MCHYLQDICLTCVTTPSKTVPTTSLKPLSQCLNIAVIKKAKIHPLHCNVNILLLVVSTTDREQVIHFAVNFMLLKIEFVGCWVFFLLLLFCFLSTAKVLLSFNLSSHNVFSATDHICYFSLGSFQLDSHYSRCLVLKSGQHIPAKVLTGAD